MVDWNKYNKFFTIQAVLVILIVLVILNMITIILQSTTTENVMRIKQGQDKSTSAICDLLVRRYERRALGLAYRSLTAEDLSDVEVINIKEIPLEDIVYVKLKDGSTIPVAYFDSKGFLQTIFIGNTPVVEEPMETK